MNGNDVLARFAGCPVLVVGDLMAGDRTLDMAAKYGLSPVRRWAVSGRRC